MADDIRLLGSFAGLFCALMYMLEARAHRKTLDAWLMDCKRWQAAAAGVVEQWHKEVNDHMTAVAILSDARACLPADLLLRYRTHLFNQAEALSRVIAWRNSLDKWNEPVEARKERRA